MPEKFVVPQFIENEDKILGPITVRQFLLMIGGAGVLFVEYMILPLALLILIGLATIGIVIVFAFVKINGQPFHIFFVNFLQTRIRPSLRVWNKELTTAQLRDFLREPPKVETIVRQLKPRPESTRLRDLSLTVNTGGVYNPDQDDYAK